MNVAEKKRKCVREVVDVLVIRLCPSLRCCVIYNRVWQISTKRAIAKIAHQSLISSESIHFTGSLSVGRTGTRLKSRNLH